MMDTNSRPTLDDLAALFTNQLQGDSQHEHKPKFVWWVGARAEYQCVECGYTFQANH